MLLKKFTGRTLQPAKRAAELLPPDQRWCGLCHQAVLKKYWMEHSQSRGHRLALKKVNKLKSLSLSIWERHREAPLDEASPHEAAFQQEFSRYQQNRRQREEEYFRQLW